MIEKTCDTCGDTFIPIRRYKDCMPCVRKRQSYNPCPTCGTPKKKVSSLCGECAKGPEPMLNNMTKEQVAWLAGLLDGEGSFLIKKNTGCVKVEMTDEDVILNIKEITGVGNVLKIKKRASHHKQSWVWHVTRLSVLKRLVVLVYPWMCIRRKQQIQRMKFVQEQTFKNILADSEQNFHPSEDEMFAWLAGHLEGEGYFGGKGITTSSIDKDTIMRVQELFEKPVYGLVSRSNHNEKIAFRIGVYKADDVTRIVNRILPLLLSRRTIQAEKLLVKKQKVIHLRTVNPAYKIGDSKPCTICDTLFIVAKNDTSYCRPCLYKKSTSAKTPCPGCGGIMSRYAQQCQVCASGGKKSPSKLSQL